MSTLAVDTWTLLRRELLRYRRDRAYWVGQIVFPLAVVAFVGLGPERAGPLPTGADYTGHLASGIVALLIGSGGVGAGFTLIEDRQSGFLRALLIAPVARASLVLGKLLARIVVSLVLVGVLLALLALFTPLRVHHAGALLVGVAGITAVFVALGVGLAVRLGRLESFRMLAAFATVPLYLASGILYPLASLATPVRWLAHANPLTYGVDLVRYGLLDVYEIPVALSAVLLLVLATAATLLAVAAVDRRAAA